MLSHLRDSITFTENQERLNAIHNHPNAGSATNTLNSRFSTRLPSRFPFGSQARELESFGLVDTCSALVEACSDDKGGSSRGMPERGSWKSRCGGRRGQHRHFERVSVLFCVHIAFRRY